MNQLDKTTRDLIAASVERAVQKAMEDSNEVWLTAKQLCEQVGFFTVEWLKHYGRLLPREHSDIVNKYGDIVHTSHWYYPKHKIQRMIQNGELRCITIK